MRSRVADFVALLLLATSVHAAPIDTNVYVLNLTGKGTLTDVFASGLRAEKVGSLPLMENALSKTNFLKFKIRGAEPVTNLMRRTCVFKVYAMGSLASIQAQARTFPWMLRANG